MNHLTDDSVFTDSTQYARAMTFNQSNGGANALVEARKLTGREYVFGGWPANGGGTDCSGLVEWAYEQVGVYLPRTTYSQYLVHAIGPKTPYETGDLIFIAGSDAIGKAPGHVMIYVSPGQVFQAPFTGEKIGQYPYDTSVFEYRTRPSLALKPAPKPAWIPPTAHQIALACVVQLKNPAEAAEALNNGWRIFIWDGSKFEDAPAKHPNNPTEYATFGWQKRRK
jgi:hypothetical protein